MVVRVTPVLVQRQPMFRQGGLASPLSTRGSGSEGLNLGVSSWGWGRLGRGGLSTGLLDEAPRLALSSPWWGLAVRPGGGVASRWGRSCAGGKGGGWVGGQPQE